MSLISPSRNIYLNHVNFIRLELANGLVLVQNRFYVNSLVAAVRGLNNHPPFRTYGKPEFRCDV